MSFFSIFFSFPVFSSFHLPCYLHFPLLVFSSLPSFISPMFPSLPTPVHHLLQFLLNFLCLYLFLLPFFSHWQYHFLLTTVWCQGFGAAVVHGGRGLYFYTMHAI